MTASAATDVHDVVVYGATPAGIAASVAAKRMGMSVVLIEPTQRIGGLTTGGLGQTDVGGNRGAFGGLSRQFYADVYAYYHDKKNWTRQEPKDYRHRVKSGGPTGKTMWTFEPHAALAVLERWERENGLEIRRGVRLDRGKGKVKVEEVKVKGQGQQKRIVSFCAESGEVFRGKMFVDASYEGDLMAAAGVSYSVGREANAEYGEKANGIETARSRSHQFEDGVSPYVVEGDPKSGLLPGVEPYNPNEADGTGDRRVQAYNYRLCLTDDPENRIPFEKPANYDEREYELLFRNYAARLKAGKKPENPVGLHTLMPNRKTDSNNSGAFSSDFIGRNYAYPEASHAEREKIAAAHLDYVKGLLWTAANHPRVPEAIRAEFFRWGVCKDEFVENGGWPTALYVREARRMKGLYVMTEADNRCTRFAPQPIACGVYQIDSHNVRRHVTKEGWVRNEGDVQDCNRQLPADWATAYSIGYGAICPKREECSNLLVPVCVSSTHVAFGSIRMEPVFFALGQAAGTAAALAVQDGAAVQDVDYGRLSARLLKDGQVLRDPRLADLRVRRGVGVFSPDARVEMRFYALPTPRFAVYTWRHLTVPETEIAGLADPGEATSIIERKIPGKTPDDCREVTVRTTSGTVVRIYAANDHVAYRVATADGKTLEKRLEVAPTVGAPAGLAAEYFRAAIADPKTDICDYAQEDPFGPDFEFDFPGAPVADGLPRFYGLKGLRNVRDVGGWTGLRTGRVFRGSQLYWVEGEKDGVDPVTRRVLTEELKIKTDLDLRGSKKWGVIEYSSKGLNELQALGIAKSAHKFPSYEALLRHPEIVAPAVREFADAAKYPFYVHCAGGADRTGSLIFILEALCGVSELKMDVDYELTSFTTIYGLRYRTCVERLPWKTFKDQVRAKYPAENLKSSVEKWMKAIGLTEAELAAIRANLR